MKIIKSLIILLIVSSLLFTTGCATVFGGRIDHCQVDKVALKKETGAQTRHIRWGAFIFDCILIPGPIINLGIDFLTRAIYKPCEWYTPGNSQNSQSAPVSIDVVYLKDGSIIKGTISEQVPNKSIKIKTKDGSIFNYTNDKIVKITKE